MQRMLPVFFYLDWSAGARTKRRASGERPRAHAEVRCKWRRNVAKRIAAARAKFAADDVGTKPVAVGFTNGVDALHGAARQELHSRFLRESPCDV